MFNRFDMKAFEFQQKEIIEYQYGDCHAQSHDSGYERFPNAGCQRSRVRRGVPGNSLKYTYHAENSAEQSQ